MRLLLLVLVAGSAAAQTPGLPQFSDYPAGPLHRGRVAPLDVTSSPNARLYRTATREHMARGVNFAGRYVVATWGCGTECVAGHIVDARTGRAVKDLPFATPYMTFQMDSRLIAVMTPADILVMFPADEDEAVPSRYESSYWVWERGALRHLGSLVASDLEAIRRGRPAPPLRTATPGDVLVPLTVGNTWTYSSLSAQSPLTVTYRVTGADPEPYSDGLLVERTARDAGGTRRTVETWFPGYGVGDGSFGTRAGDEYAGFSYRFGVAQADGLGERVERETTHVGGAAQQAVCYVAGPHATEDGYSVGPDAPQRTCFVPRVGMVSRTEAGATLALTAHTLR